MSTWLSRPKQKSVRYEFWLRSGRKITTDWVALDKDGLHPQDVGSTAAINFRFPSKGRTVHLAASHVEAIFAEYKE